MFFKHMMAASLVTRSIRSFLLFLHTQHKAFEGLFSWKPWVFGTWCSLCILWGDRWSCKQEFSAHGVLQPESYASGFSLVSCSGIQEIYLPGSFPFFPIFSPSKSINFSRFLNRSCHECLWSFGPWELSIKQSYHIVIKTLLTFQSSRA